MLLFAPSGESALEVNRANRRRVVYATCWSSTREDSEKLSFGGYAK